MKPLDISTTVSERGMNNKSKFQLEDIKVINNKFLDPQSMRVSNYLKTKQQIEFDNQRVKTPKKIRKRSKATLMQDKHQLYVSSISKSVTSLMDVHHKQFKKMNSGMSQRSIDSAYSKGRQHDETPEQLRKNIVKQSKSQNNKKRSNVRVVKSQEFELGFKQKKELQLQELMMMQIQELPYDSTAPKITELTQESQINDLPSLDKSQKKTKNAKNDKQRKDEMKSKDYYKLYSSLATNGINQQVRGSSSLKVRSSKQYQFMTKRNANFLHDNYGTNQLDQKRLNTKQQTMSLKSDSTVLLVSKYKSNKSITTTNITMNERPPKKLIQQGARSQIQLPDINLKNTDLIPGILKKPNLISKQNKKTKNLEKINWQE